MSIVAKKPTDAKSSTNGHAGANGKSEAKPSGGSLLLDRYGDRVCKAATEHANVPPNYEGQPSTDGQEAEQQSKHLEYIAKQFQGARRSGAGWKAHCPAHKDRKPSLSISSGRLGGVVLHCHAGCDYDVILAVAEIDRRELAPGAALKKKVAFTYSYRDEQKNILYQTQRYVPKDFRQRRPDGNGGWIYNLESVSRVLYRLPQLLNSKRSEFVFVVEGEKDAERLASLGLIATTNLGGAKSPWLDSYSESLKSRRVVLLPDNDAVGWDRVKDIARQLRGNAASVRIVELPNLVAKGDVSDWLDNGGTREKLLALVKNTAPEGSGGNGKPETLPEAFPLEETEKTDRSSAASVSRFTFPCPPPFPIEVLPKKLRLFVTSGAKALNCPPDFLGAPLLAVLSTFIGRKQHVRVKKDWREYAVLWIAVVGDSGTRKSPALAAVSAPLREKQLQLLKDYRDEKREWQKLSKEDRDVVEKPRLKQLFTTDATVEAMKLVLDGNPNGIIFLADELTSWARGLNQYKGGRGNDRPFWLSAWSCSPVVCNRVQQDEPLVIDTPFASIAGGIQPAILGDLIDDAQEDGFAARPLYSFPEPISNSDWTEDVIEGADDYNKVCENLWNLAESSTPVTLSDKAKLRWVEWVNLHRKEEPPDHLRAVWSKAEGHCLRLALVLFLSRRAAGDVKGEQIDAASMSGAAKLISYFKNHCARAYAYAAGKKDDDPVARVVRWVERQWATGTTVTARLVQQRLRNVCKTTEEAQKLLHDLAELGYGEVVEGSKGSVIFRPAGSVRKQETGNTSKEGKNNADEKKGN